MYCLRAVVLLMALATDRCPLATADATLQFVSSQDRQLGFYRAPSTYHHGGKSPMNSIIITSKPFQIGRDTHRNPWRKHFSTTTPGKPTTTTTTTTTTPRPQTTIHIPTFTIDCEGNKACSETINMEGDPSNPTFKPYSKEELTKFFGQIQEEPSRERPMSNVHTFNTPMDGHNDKSSNEKANALNPFPFAFSRLPPHHDFPDFPKMVDSDIPERDHPQKPGFPTEERLANRLSEWPDENGSSVSAPDPELDKSKAATWTLSKDPHAQYTSYNEQEGWVTLEPIPWSSSKITKWILNKKPPTSTEAAPWSTHPSRWPTKTSTEKPPWNRPLPWQVQQNSEPVIITDGIPPKWPTHVSQNSHVSTWLEKEPPPPPERPSHWDSFDKGRPPVVVQHRPWQKPWSPQKPEVHVDDYNAPPLRRPTPVIYHGVDSNDDPEDGRWVLLSSTKDYMLPNRRKPGSKRSYAFSSKPMGIRLTVLPSANGINTTTSHGGLLEVENNFDSVDVAGQLADKPQNDDPGNATSAAGTRFVARRVVTNNPSANSRAVLAAIGAGIVPATMAVLVPLMLGRKRRSTIVPPSTTPIPSAAMRNVFLPNSQHNFMKKMGLPARNVKRRKVVRRKHVNRLSVQRA